MYENPNNASIPLNKLDQSLMDEQTVYPLSLKQRCFTRESVFTKTILVLAFIAMIVWVTWISINVLELGEETDVVGQDLPVAEDLQLGRSMGSDHHHQECWTAGGCGDNEKCGWCGTHQGAQQYCCRHDWSYQAGDSCHYVEEWGSLPDHQCVTVNIAGNHYNYNEGEAGGWGGYCKCLNGETYAVGDNYDACGSLACHGGVELGCNRYDGEWSHHSVSCGMLGAQHSTMLGAQHSTNDEIDTALQTNDENDTALQLGSALSCDSGGCCNCSRQGSFWSGSCAVTLDACVLTGQSCRCESIAGICVGHCR